MKKSIVLLCLCLLIATITTAQEQKLRYQGEVKAGIGIWLTDDNDGTVTLAFETIHGVRINRYLFVGVGANAILSEPAQYYCSTYPGVECTYTPPSYEFYTGAVFGNIKGYLPISRIVSAYASLDLGCEYVGDNRFYYSPALGMSFKTSKRTAVNLGIGYHAFINKSYYEIRSADHMLSILVGFAF